MAHYKVNDDVYGRIIKPRKIPSPVECDYAEVYQVCNGLGIIILYFNDIALDFCVNEYECLFNCVYSESFLLY